MVSLTPASSTINQTRFEELWSENESSVRRYVWSLKVGARDVDGIVQDTAIALWRKFNAYDSMRPFAPWACRFAVLQVLKQRQRAARNRVFLPDDDWILTIPADQDRESDMNFARREALDESIRLLDESDQQLIQCRYDSKETIQELAKRRATSVHKLYHSLDHIRETLKIAIDDFMLKDGWERDELL
jgi:RNA polymerase sigma-70 factor, ECF subfamily